MSTHADDAVVDPWVVLRRLMEENRALRAEREELRDRVDELELRLAQQPTTVPVHEDRPVLVPVAEGPTPEAVDDSSAPATGDDGAVPALPDISALLRPWQRDALAAWQAAGRRGVVEAVTGAGKTFVGICATRDAVAAGGRALVLVPTRELQEQWVRVLVEQLPDVVVGRLGGGRQDELAECDVLVAIVHSAAARSLRPRPGDVLVADECHRYGAPTFAHALEDGFEQRLGLTATYQREDDGVATYLRPFFGDVVFTLWYDRALADGIIAPFDIALGAVQLTPEEQQQYDDCGERMEKAARNLEWRHGIAREPYEQFMAQVSRMARGERSDPLSIAARAYLGPMSARRALLAESRGKLDALALLEPAVRRAHGALVFTQTKESAESAAGLFEEAGIPAAALYSGLHDDDRRDRMDAFRERASQLLAAPRVLDEGLDVPEADLAVIVAASRSRRQLVQRLGRVLRPKSDGRPARLVMLYAKGTLEDPTLYIDSPLTAVLPHSRRDGDFGLPTQRDGMLRFLLGDDAELPPPPVPGGDAAPAEVRPDVPVPPPSTPTTHREVQSLGKKHGRPRTAHIAAPPNGEPPTGSSWGDAEDVQAAEAARKEAEELAATDGVRAYYKQIARFELLDAEQEVDLAKRIEVGLFAGERLRRAQDKQFRLTPQMRRDLQWLVRDGARAKTAMIEANVRLVVSLAKRYTGQGLGFLDLIQEGNLGLIRAVEKFDFMQGYKFSTYATWWIRQALSRAVADQGRTIRLPVHVVEQLDAFRRAVREAAARGHPIETPDEISKAVGEPVDDVLRYLRLLRGIWSLDELLENPNVESGLRQLQQDDTEAQDAKDRHELAERALDELQPRPRQVLRMRFGFETGEPMTLDDIGRHFGVTRERIRQIESKALEWLARRVTRDFSYGGTPQASPSRRTPRPAVPMTVTAMDGPQSIVERYVRTHVETPTSVDADRSTGPGHETSVAGSR